MFDRNVQSNTSTPYRAPALNTLETPSRAEKDWPPAVVGGVFQTGLNLIRDLTRKGVRAVGVDHDLTHQGFRSVYGKSYACPNPDTHPEQWVEFMKNLACKMEMKPVFIPAADVFVAALGRHGEALADDYLISPRGAELQASLTTKETQYALATEHGFPCPRMAYVQSSAELKAFIADARFPCLIKPRSQREWDALPEGNSLRGNKIMIAETRDELLRYYELAEPYRPEVIAQEVIQGPGSAKFYYVSAYGNGGSLLGSCVLQAVRDHPPFTGMPTIVRPVVDAEITSLCDGFLRKVNYRGICEFELKRDIRDGKVRLIEINPRFSGTGDCASYVGIETGWLHYLDMIGQPVAPVQPSRFGFYHIALKLESMEAPRFLLSGDLKWKDFVTPYRGPKAFYDLDFRDPRLAATTVALCGRYVVGNLLRHWKLRSPGG
ncbi:MAG: ATP-grasp protein [Bryobacterales bacterium]|nr:ATP-grasp protein [Bryobacterales bacterium]